METGKMRIFVLSVIGYGILFFAGCAQQTSVPAIAVGNGVSLLSAPDAAGIEAAQKAKAGLGGNEAKVVLVFDSLKAKASQKEKMLAGVAEVFDASIIYGCSTYDAITEESNKGKVGVLALGGGINVATAVSNIDGGHKACGERIGEALKKASQAKSQGKLLIMFGSCHVPLDNDLTLGAASILGEAIPIVGGAASKGEFVYYKGKVVDGKSNVGLLVTGDFDCGFSMVKGDGKEETIAIAGTAFTAAAAATDSDNIKLMFAFDCGGRRGIMGGEIGRELAGMKKAVGQVPIFGFYGSGEIGKTDNNTASRGVGFHLSVCALSAK